MSRIEIVVHPYAYELLQSRTDQAAITGQPMIERPFWYKNTETGQLYYDLFGCVGWPTEVSETSNGLPGYVGIIGVVKPKEEGKPIQDAAFQLLAEGESKDVTSMFEMITAMRKEYGFGLHPDLLQAWFGDPERHVTTIALFNERLIAKGGERAAILIIPPNDFYVQHSFDHYMRSLM
ncbi:MAG: hypothetical protein WCW53_06915 [Syntrophales bacterium]|nr:hypothetical protein [Syntrophales bacterium]